MGSVDEQYLREQVEIACDRADWSTQLSWPRVLRLLGEVFSESFITKYERSIQAYASKCAKYPGSFDFTAHFEGKLATQHNRGRQKFPTTSAIPSGQSTSAEEHSHSGGRGTGMAVQNGCGINDNGSTSDITDTAKPTIRAGTPYRPAPDAFSQKKVFELAEKEPYKAIRAWSFDKEKHVALVAAEGLTQNCWISNRAVHKLVEQPEINPDKHAAPERVGEVELVSGGLLGVQVHPYQCVQHTWITFNVHNDPQGPDMLISHDEAARVGELRRQGRRYRPESNPAEPPLLSNLQDLQNTGESTRPSSRHPQQDVSAVDALRPLVAGADGGGEIAQMKRQKLLNATQALGLLIFVALLTVALDILFYVAKINDPSYEMSLGSGIVLLLKLLTQLLPQLELTSLTLIGEILFVGSIGSYWWRSDMNFLHWRQKADP